MFRQFWKLLKAITLAFGLLLSFFALIEILHAYQVLHGVHPAVGYTFAILLLLAIVVGAVRYAASLGSRPGALRPPPGFDPAAAGGQALRTYARYQVRLMRRLAANRRLDDERRAALGARADQLHAFLGRKPADAELSETVAELERVTIREAYAALDIYAQDEVSRCVRDIMLAVTLSPWRSVDLLIVLYRNLRMVAGLAGIYNTRPSPREQMSILRDVFAIVATVNFLNYGSNLLQNLTASVPFLGRFTDDIAQGIGAGLLTSVAGHAAIDRCRAYRGWSQAAAEQRLRGRLRDFIKDVKTIVVTDVLRRLRKPMEAQVPAAERPPDMERRIRAGIEDAMDESASLVETLFMRPVAAAGRGVADTGTAVGKAVYRGSSATLRGVAAGTLTVGGALGTATLASGRLAGRAVKGTGEGLVKGVRALWRGAGRGWRKAIGRPDDSIENSTEDATRNGRNGDHI